METFGLFPDQCELETCTIDFEGLNEGGDFVIWNRIDYRPHNTCAIPGVPIIFGFPSWFHLIS